MKISKEEVEHVAKLARLKLSPEEVEKYQKQMGSILAYVDKLNELDVKSVPEMQHAAGSANVFRDDEVQACDQDTRDRIIEAFPQKEGDLLEVQAVFENTET